MHPEFKSPPVLRRPVTLDVDGEPLGILIPADTGVRFLAVRLRAFALDGVQFDSVETARAVLAEAVRNPAVEPAETTHGIS